MRPSQGVWAGALLVLSAFAGCADKSSAPMEEAEASRASAAPRPGPGAGDALSTAGPQATIGGIEDRGGEGAKDSPRGTWGSPSSMPQGQSPELADDPSGPGLPPARVGAGETQRKSSVMQAFASDVGGKLDSADVQATIDKSGDKLRACITTDTRVNVKINVLLSGAVGDVRVPSAIPNDPKIRDCVGAVLRGLVFPRPKGTEAASITMDLDLRKQGPQ